MARVAVTVKIDEGLAARIDKIVQESILEKAATYEQALTLFEQLHSSRETLEWLHKTATASHLSLEQTILAVIQITRFDEPRGLKLVPLRPKDNVEEMIMEQIKVKYEKSNHMGLPFDIWLDDQAAGSNFIKGESLLSDEERRRHWRTQR